MYPFIVCGIIAAQVTTQRRNPRKTKKKKLKTKYLDDFVKERGVVELVELLWSLMTT
jgi:hypothetical protein